MKKILLALIAAIMSLALLACGGTENASTENAGGSEVASSEETKAEGTGTFRVGYAKENVTPEDPVPLSGYGNSDKRMSNGYLDYIYTTCIAVSDAEDNTLLFFTVDLAAASTSISREIRATVSAELGIPEDNIMITATHTHSSVDTAYTGIKSVTEFIEVYKNSSLKAAHDAMEDRATATMKVGTADLTGYNFVRHYFTDLDESIGDNHGEPWSGTVNRHVTTANPTMYLVEFDREDGKKPVVLANWRCHDHITGGGSKYNLSADFTGYMRTCLEKTEGILFAYYQGDAGNINPCTRLKEDGVDGVTIQITMERNYKTYGKEIAEIAAKALKENMKEVATGTVGVKKVTFTGNVNHTQDSLLGVAQSIQAYWTETNDRTGAVNMGIEYGIASPYHANAIISRSGAGQTKEVEVLYGQIGSIGFVEVPFEVFDTNGNWLRENSPYETTLFIGYSNAHHGYLPSQYGYEYGCYEADISTFEPGTAEKLMETLLNGLKEMANGQ